MVIPGISRMHTRHALTGLHWQHDEKVAVSGWSAPIGHSSRLRIMLQHLSGRRRPVVTRAMLTPLRAKSPEWQGHCSRAVRAGRSSCQRSQWAAAPLPPSKSSVDGASTPTFRDTLRTQKHPGTQHKCSNRDHRQIQLRPVVTGILEATSLKPSAFLSSTPGLIRARCPRRVAPSPGQPAAPARG